MELRVRPRNQSPPLSVAASDRLRLAFIRHGAHAGWFGATIQSIDLRTDRVCVTFVRPYVSYGPAWKKATRLRLQPPP